MENEYNTKRLTLALHTVFAELQDALQDGKPAGGGFTSKRIRGRRYWYRQAVGEDGVRRQQYLGPETPELMERIARDSALIEAGRAGEDNRRDLVMALRGGGFHGPDALTGRTIKSMADAGLFDRGAVLAGSTAMGVLGNMLGVGFETQSLRTDDVDIVHPALEIAGARSDLSLEDILKKADPRFMAVPGLDPRALPSSFKIPGTTFRVDLLAQSRRREEGAVPIPGLEASGAALPFLDYLVEKPVNTVLLYGTGVPVSVPSPARFAFHKLLVAADRPVSMQAKSRKDLVQAGALLEVLLAERPHEVAEAMTDLVGRGKGWRTRLDASLAKLPSAIQAGVLDLVPRIPDQEEGSRIAAKGKNNKKEQTTKRGKGD